MRTAGVHPWGERVALRNSFLFRAFSFFRGSISYCFHRRLPRGMKYLIDRLNGKINLPPIRLKKRTIGSRKERIQKRRHLARAGKRTGTMRLFSKIERDIGVCAVLMCPHCQTVSRFTLRQVRAAVILFGVPLFDVDRCYQLFCSSCKFRKDLDPRELFPAMRTKRLYLRLEAGVIDPSQYLRALDALKFPSLCELRENARIWICPSCGEKVPPNFHECWKCGTPRPGVQSIAPTDDSNVPQLPRAVTRPTNPWEGP